MVALAKTNTYKVPNAQKKNLILSVTYFFTITKKLSTIPCTRTISSTLKIIFTRDISKLAFVHLHTIMLNNS